MITLQGRARRRPRWKRASLWSRRRRLFGAFVAVVLGVSFLTATLLLADSLRSAGESPLVTGSSEVDVVVRGDLVSEVSEHRQRVPPGVVASVVADRGVAEAEGQVVEATTGQLLRPDGAPSAGLVQVDSWVRAESLRPAPLIAGRGPERSGEAVLDRGTADRAGARLGDRVRLATPSGVYEAVLVGLTPQQPIGGRGAVTLADAQRLANASGAVDRVLVRAAEDEELGELRRRLSALAAPHEVLRGESFRRQLAADVQGDLALVPSLLLGFAALAIGIGSLIVANTFSMLAAESRRELAVLRTIGATRGQVFGSLVREAATTGFVGSVVGIGLGAVIVRQAPGAARLAGVELPEAGWSHPLSTIVGALLVGVVVAAASSLLASWRAASVPPIAGLRTSEVEEPTLPWFRRILGGVLLVAAVAASVVVAAGPRGSNLPLVAVTGVAVIAATLVLGPVLMAGAARSFAALPGGRRGSRPLAQQGARNRPRRAAATMAGLFTGVFLVSSVSAFASSLEASITDKVARGFAGDLVLRHPQGEPISASLVAAIEALPEVAGVTRIRRDRLGVTKPTGITELEGVAGIDPRSLRETVHVTMREGTVDDLPPNGIVIDRQIADADDLAIGDQVTVAFPTGGITLRVHAISDDILFAGNWLVRFDTFGSRNPAELDYQVPIRAAEGADIHQLTNAIRSLAQQHHPTTEVLDRTNFVAANAAQVQLVVNVVYALLGISVLVAVIGIMNTLSISILERTRELGLLRTIGMTRPQLRSLLRWEAALISVTGTAVGTTVALATTWLLVHAMTGQGLTRFALDVPFAAMLLGAFVALGIAASIPPGIRVSRLDPVEALAGTR